VVDVLWKGWDEAAMYVRRAAPDDAAIVAEIVRAACAESLAEGFPLSGAGESAEAVLRDLPTREVYVLCRQSDGYAVATLRLHTPPGTDYLYVTRLSVRPGWQRRGLAGQLLAFAEAEAARRGLRSLRLDTPAGYARLLRLYQKYGFSAAAHAALPGRPYTSVILERLLPAPAAIETTPIQSVNSH
jgi:ribosomal protein S18 acetylase RimI-like enzyme